MYNATNAATWLRSPPRIALRLNSTQRFVCYYATNSAPHRPSLHRVDALRTLSLRSTAQLNDLFVITLRFAARRSAPRLVSIQLNDLFITSLFASLLNSTICLLQRPRNASHGSSTWLLAKQRNDLFVNLLSRLDTALGNEPRRNSPCRDAQQLNATN